MGNRTLLIDHDIVMFKAACVHEFDIYWDNVKNDNVSRYIDPNAAIMSMNTAIIQLMEETGCADYICCLSNALNFRYVVLPTYKHNRQNVEKPQLLEVLREYTVENHPHRDKRWLEADDCLGVMATKWPEKYVICTIDKDLKQIPGLHYNPMHKDWGVHEIDDEAADRWFWRQVLTGDSTDGYPGCPGCGPKKADDVLDAWFPLDEEGMWQAVVGTYGEAPAWRIKKQYGQDDPISEEQILQQARVARILRHTDYDFKKQEVIFWTPKGYAGS